MSYLSIAMAALLGFSQSTLAQTDRKTVYIDKLNGLEDFIDKDVKQMELPLELIKESEHPDLKVLLGKKFTSVHAEVLYRKNTGRTEDSKLELVDIKTGKVLASYSFKWSNDEATKKEIAHTFTLRMMAALK
jgi:hypothetical protein